MEQEQEKEKKDFKEIFYGSAYRNDTLVNLKTGETQNLPIPFYAMQLKRDMVEKLTTSEDGMLHFSIHARKNQEFGKPNCNIIYNKNFLSDGKYVDIHSIKDFSEERGYDESAC